MKVSRIVTKVDVVGHIWQPRVGLCAYTYSPREDELADEAGRVSRESVQAWLDTHAGDFSKVVDFRATVGDGVFDCDFADPENELVFTFAMFSEWDEDE